MTILVMLSAFQDMNIPTLLYELSVEIENRAVHEIYENTDTLSKQGTWDDEQWHKYGHKCLCCHMTQQRPLLGPHCKDLKVTAVDAEGNKKIVWTYSKDTREEILKATEDLSKLLKHYLFVVDDIDWYNVEFNKMGV